MENTKKPKDLYKKALHILAKIWGKEYVYIVDTYFLLANASTHNKEYETAKELHAKALEVQRKISGVEHVGLAYSYDGLRDV